MSESMWVDVIKYQSLGADMVKPTLHVLLGIPASSFPIQHLTKVPRVTVGRDRVSGSQHQPGPALTIVSFRGMNQQMQVFSSVSLPLLFK